MNYLDVKWRAKIIWAYLTLFWLCLLDEGTDVYEAYKHFMNDDPIFGSLTVGFMFLPAINTRGCPLGIPTLGNIGEYCDLSSPFPMGKF